jgi:hypothetical protein
MPPSLRMVETFTTVAHKSKCPSYGQQVTKKQTRSSFIYYAAHIDFTEVTAVDSVAELNTVSGQNINLQRPSYQIAYCLR